MDKVTVHRSSVKNRNTPDFPSGFKDGVNTCCGSGAYRGEFCGYINSKLETTGKSPYQYRGMFHALSTMLWEEDPQALYKGWLPSVIGVV
ncbi:uncharacterized protein [Euphorbia lathyris]|uniref:uncharacterized protein isoform X2 n=1 Tax=Euphorbia lathyris TaxID=212925 RepID=UPI003313F771